jgi:hypothetical protein
VRPAIAASTTSGDETAKSARWVLPDAEEVDTQAIRKDSLIDNVADNLRVGEETTIGPGGDVPKRVQSEFEILCHAVLFSSVSASSASQR